MMENHRAANRGDDLTLVRVSEIVTESDPIARVAIARMNFRRPTLSRQRRGVDGLLDSLLSSTFPKGPDGWALYRAASGAPRLRRTFDGSPKLRVSISHRTSWVAVGITTTLGIGIDIEIVRPERPTAELAAFLGWDLSAMKPDEFYRQWTLWEAYNKCRERTLLTPVGPEFQKLRNRSLRRAKTRWHAFDLPRIKSVRATVVLQTEKPECLQLRPCSPNRLSPW
jgi:hypothetical protein